MSKQTQHTLHPVGRSSRTPFKHFLLDSCIGRIVGVGGTNPVWPNFRKYPLLVVDLCAGDGLIVEGEHRSSPHILHYHCHNAMQPKRKGFSPFNVDLRFIEKSPHAFADLLVAVKTYQLRVEEPHCKYILGDAREVKWSAQHESQPCFINADPNHVNDLPIPPDMAARLTKATTFVVTLGCNVGGLKRLDYETRLHWFDYMNTLLSLLRSWHDALLIKLEGDASQWAYLLCLPVRWAASEAKKILKAADTFEMPVTVASYRNQPADFRRLTDTLFLTRTELKARYGN